MVICKTNVPHFHVEKSDVTSYTSTGEIVFNVSVLDNVTIHYSTSTGRFTALYQEHIFAFNINRNTSYVKGGLLKMGHNIDIINFINNMKMVLIKIWFIFQ